MRRFCLRTLKIVSVLFLAVVVMLVAFYLVLVFLLYCCPAPQEVVFFSEVYNDTPLLLSPHWSPDGTHITFGNTGFSPRRGEIFTIDMDRMRLHKVHGAAGSDDLAFAPSLSNDGSRVAYVAVEHPTWLPWVKHYGWKITTSDLYGSRKRTLTKKESWDLYPVWSPDGTRIAFLSTRDFQDRIYVMDPDGSDVRNVTPSVEAWRYLPPVWSPDGRSLAFVGQDGVVTRYGDETICGHHRLLQRSLYSVEVDGGEPRRVGLILDRTLPAWSPNGRRIAFSTLNDCLEELHTVAPDGSEPATLLLGAKGSAPYGISWSPDGRKLLIGSVIVEADGSAIQRLPTPRSTASWSPDGSRIAVHVLNDGTRSALGGYDPSVRLYTMASDGSDVRILVVQDRDGNLSTAHGRPRDATLVHD